jgi:ABC-2 type transport system permease protein
MAILTIALLCVAGAAFGVHLSADKWCTVIGLLLVGLIPFAVLGVALGHLLSTDSLAPAVAGITSLFSLLGGVYGFQLAKSGALFQVIKALPSYWLVQALGGGSWATEGWLVILGWTAILTPLAVLAYRRDTARV